MRQIIVSHDFKDVGRVLNFQDIPCRCGNMRFLVRWSNGKIQSLCIADMMEVSWGAWKVLTYKIAIYRKETVGSRFVKYVEVTEKPSLDTGYWFDLTNGIWAKWESIHDKKLADMSVEPGN